MVRTQNTPSRVQGPFWPAGPFCGPRAKVQCLRQVGRRPAFCTVHNLLETTRNPFGRGPVPEESEHMRYQISGKQIEIGEALQHHVKEELGAVVEKYAGRPTEAVVVFSKSAHEYVCDATVHLSTGLTSQAKAHATEIYAAFDKCAERMGKQLRRYKRRLKDHYKERPDPVEVLSGSTYILAGSEGDDEGTEPESLQPLIIAEMETRIPRVTVGEAVMQLELAGSRLLVFRNEKEDRVNVVYKRDDGNIGWIDPSGS